jgi:hypothetical protein
MLSRVGDMGFLLFIVSVKNGIGVITHVPALYPPLKRIKDEKPRAVAAVYIVRGWLCGYLGKGCLERGNVELSYLLLSHFFIPDDLRW